MMEPFSVIEAPSILGLKPSGVEMLPDALKQAGLIEGLQADEAGRLEAPVYNPERDTATLLLNPHSIRAFSFQLAEKVIEVRSKGYFPVVLGGDCSVLTGLSQADPKE